MGLFGYWYCITCWNGEERFLTAKELRDEVIKDSLKSDYNWIASATELVRVCNQIDFPEQYAKEIKIAILNCFTNLETKREISSRGEPTDPDAVYSCYNSLTGTDETVVKVKQKYLTAILDGIIKYHFRILEWNSYGPTYHKICNEWKKLKFEEYSQVETLDFRNLRKVLDEDFDKTMQTAKEKGAFKEDEERELEAMRKFWVSLHTDDIDE